MLSVNKECDTQVDPRLVFSDTNVKQMSCFPVGDPATPRRRVGAKGPGIKLVGDSKPVSAAFFEGLSFEGDTRTPPNSTPSTMIGYFAAVTASSGATFFVNVDDDFYGDTVNANMPFVTQVPLAISHQLRDQTPDRNEVDLQPYTCDNAGPDPDSSTGQVTADPRAPLAPAGTLPATGDVSTARAGELPSIHDEECSVNGAQVPVSDVQFAAPNRDNGVTFPDLFDVANDETWTMIWEGTLSLDDVSHAIDGPIVRTGELSIENAGGMDLVDATAPFCDAGVEPYDIVQLRGCDPSHGDADCPFGYTCFVHPDSQVAGLGACMRRERGGAPRRRVQGVPDLAAPLHGRQVDHRRARADAAHARSAHDAGRRLHGRRPVPEPRELPAAARRLAQPRRRHVGLGHAHLRVPRGPVAQADRRAPARAASRPARPTTTATAAPCATAALCMEGVVPPQACVNAPQRYELRAGEAFAVVGSVSGYVHPIIADAGGELRRRPDRAARSRSAASR